jgi:hypothetical protein
MFCYNPRESCCSTEALENRHASLFKDWPGEICGKLWYLTALYTTPLIDGVVVNTLNCCMQVLAHISGCKEDK